MFKSKIFVIFIIPILISLSISLAIFFSGKVDLVKAIVNFENNCYAAPRIREVASSLMRKGYVVEIQLIDTVNSKFSTFSCDQNPIMRIKYVSKYRDYIFTSLNNEFEYISRLEKIKLSNQIYALDEIINSSSIHYKKYHFENIKDYLGDKFRNKTNFTEKEIYLQKKILRQEQKQLQFNLNNTGQITYEEFSVDNTIHKKFLQEILPIFLFLSIFFVLFFYSLFKLSVIRLK